MNAKDKIQNLIDPSEAKRIMTKGTKSEEVYAKQKRAYEIAYQILEEAESEDKLKRFLEWLDKEENPYPLLSHNELIENLEKYELEIETSSENTQRQTEEEWLEENAGMGEEL